MTARREPGRKPSSNPAIILAKALESLESAERKEVIAWLLDRPAVSPGGWLTPTAPTLPRWTGSTGADSPVWPAGAMSYAAQLRRQFSAGLPAGEDSQLVTIRFPIEQHDRLRAWCNDHGFSLAAVVRGLVERFLEGQGSSAQGADEPA
jgi:hypothetical protein